MPGRQNSGHIGRRQTACLQCGSSYELQGCLQTPTYLHTRYTCALPTFGLVLFQPFVLFVPPFEILNVSSKTCQFICIPLRFSPEILRIKANSYCINCSKTFMKRKAKSMLHLVQLAMRLIARLISADAWKLKLVHVCRWEDNQAAIATSSQLWWDVCYPGIKC